MCANESADTTHRRPARPVLPPRAWLDAAITRGYRPDLGALLAGAGEVSRAAAEWQDDVAALSRGLAAELAALPPLRDADATALAAQRHLDHEARAAGGDPELAADIRSGALHVVFTDAHARGAERGAGGTVDDVAAALTRDGVDGARLAEAVIRFEAGKHLGLVRTMANRLAGNYADHDYDDLVGYGWQGLLIALRRYDPSRGAFSTYAATRISGEIRSGARRESPTPKRTLTLLRHVADAEDELLQTLARRPTLEEVADRVGTDLERIRTHLLREQLAWPSSIDELTDDTHDQRETPTWLAGDDDTAEAAATVVENERIREAVSSLPDAQAQAVRLLVLDGLSAPQAAQHCGVDARTLRRRRDDGLAALADVLGDLHPHVN